MNKEQVNKKYQSFKIFYFHSILFLRKDLIHFIFLVQNPSLCDDHSWRLTPLNGNSGVGFYKKLSESLIGRLGEHSLFPEVHSQMAVDLADGIKCGLFAQGGSTAPG